jgi:hypothetical protein
MEFSDVGAHCSDPLCRQKGACVAGRRDLEVCSLFCVLRRAVDRPPQRAVSPCCGRRRASGGFSRAMLSRAGGLLAPRTLATLRNGAGNIGREGVRSCRTRGRRRRWSERTHDTCRRTPTHDTVGAGSHHTTGTSKVEARGPPPAHISPPLPSPCLSISQTSSPSCAMRARGSGAWITAATAPTTARRAVHEVSEEGRGSLAPKTLPFLPFSLTPPPPLTAKSPPPQTTGPSCAPSAPRASTSSTVRTCTPPLTGTSRTAATPPAVGRPRPRTRAAQRRAARRSSS